MPQRARYSKPENVLVAQYVELIVTNRMPAHIVARQLNLFTDSMRVHLRKFRPELYAQLLDNQQRSRDKISSGVTPWKFEPTHAIICYNCKLLISRSSNDFIPEKLSTHKCGNKTISLNINDSVVQSLISLKQNNTAVGSWDSSYES